MLAALAIASTSSAVMSVSSTSTAAIAGSVRWRPYDRCPIMEAATPLRTPHVRTVDGDRVAVDGLVVEDDTTVRLVREREDAGDDTVALLTDAIEIGARVLDREQTGANAEYVKTEFERAARELQSDFGERARAVTDTLANGVRAPASRTAAPRPSSTASRSSSARPTRGCARTWPASCRPRTPATPWPSSRRRRWPP